MDDKSLSNNKLGIPQNDRDSCNGNLIGMSGNSKVGFAIARIATAEYNPQSRIQFFE